MYNTVLGGSLKKAHSDESQQLPIPATYILNKEGEIVWRHFDPDYKKRAKIEDIISNIPTNE
jgi:peroxiredoxin